MYEFFSHRSSIAGNLLSTSASWKYSIDQNQPEEWYTPDFDDVEWKIAKPSEFPSIRTTTMYYRTTLLLPESREDLTVYEVGIYLNVGAVIYVNGEKALTFNLPEYGTVWLDDTLGQ